jgi:hypothetical protein
VKVQDPWQLAEYPRKSSRARAGTPDDEDWGLHASRPVPVQPAAVSLRQATEWLAQRKPISRTGHTNRFCLGAEVR